MSVRMRVLAVAVILLIGVTAASAAWGQDSKHESQLRTVRGVVSDKSENPVPTSVVFLKNVRTNTVRSYIADNEGNYRFSGLDPNVDYEIHAEKDGAKSATRTISSFDNKKELVYPLKIEKKKA